MEENQTNKTDNLEREPALYSKKYFIKKFSQLKDEEVGRGSLGNQCALYHCGVGPGLGRLSFLQCPEAQELHKWLIKGLENLAENGDNSAKLKLQEWRDFEKMGITSNGGSIVPIINDYFERLELTARQAILKVLNAA